MFDSTGAEQHVRRHWIDLPEQTWIVSVAFLLGILRAPLLLLHGRIFAEEGTVYLQQAWCASTLATMMAVRQGYYSLLMNVFALIATHIVQLEYAAVVSTWMAFGVFLLTVYLATTCESFTNARMRTLAVALIFFGPPVEIWMTLLDAQFYLPICVAIICISDESRHKVLRYITLFLSGMTGPASCALTPFFWIKAYRKKTRASKIQATLLTLLSVFQAAVLLSSVHSGSRHVDFAGKLEWLGPIFFTKTFCLVLFTRLGVFGSQHILSSHPSFLVAVIFWLLFVSCAALFGKVAMSGGGKSQLLFGMAISSLLFNYAGDPASTAVIFTGEFRYFFSGTVLLALSVLIAYGRTVAGEGKAGQRLPRQRLAGILLGLALLSGMMDAVGYWARAQHNEPRWSDQVAAWRRNSKSQIQVYPPDWSQHISLDPQQRTTR